MLRTTNTVTSTSEIPWTTAKSFDAADATRYEPSPLRLNARSTTAASAIREAIVIPATVAIGRRLAWGQVVAVGTNVRTVKPTDRVLFDPEDRAEVEVRGKDYVLLRERDLHAVASERLQDGKTGLYL